MGDVAEAAVVVLVREIIVSLMVSSFSAATVANTAAIIAAGQQKNC